MEQRIFELLGRPELDPHGHAIPTLAGKVKASSHRKLSDTREGERVTVQGVSDDDPGKLRELQRRGLVPGTKLVVLAASEFEGPIEVKLQGRRETVRLGIAGGLLVRQTP